MMQRRAFGKIVLTGLATAATVSAIDWAQWRGPKQDGVSPESGLLQDWPAAGPKLVWTATGVGLGYSTVVTSGDRIFTSGDLDGQASVICLSAKDGARVWATATGKPGSLGCCASDGPRATPTVDAKAGLVFALSQHGEAVALNLQDGKQVWKTDLAGDLGGPVPEWGYSAAAVLDDGKVIYTPGGKNGTVVALDAKSGKIVWRTKEFTDAPHYSPAVVATIHGVKQYVQLTDANVVGINPKDGSLLWKAPRPGRTAVIPTPVIQGNLVYVTSGYGVGCNCFEIKKTGEKFEATELYQNKVMVNHHGGVIAIGENVYGHSDSKGWTCQNIKTGEVVWQDKTFSKGSIAYADNRFVIRREDKEGTIALIAASPAGYKEHGKFNPPNRSERHSWPHPVISNGRLYIRDQDVLLCYDLSAKG
jgi:outer membrane protein assembly factor BamB